MPEAAEAQLKIANIHYQQMEKPDRDFTHALRAEQEYRNLIMQFPTPKLVPEAKQRLWKCRKCWREREFGIGRFYYLRQSYPAAIARLESLVDRYPMYSKADELCFCSVNRMKAEIALIKRTDVLERQQMERLHKVDEQRIKNDELARERMITDFTSKAAEAYAKIITRYPAMYRADDARARLTALHQPVPRPTKAALALNKTEEKVVANKLC